MRSILYPLGSLMALVCLVAAPAAVAASDHPDISGTWQLDPARSKNLESTSGTLTIQEDGGKLTYQRSLQGGNGKSLEAQFACTTDGADCKLKENGHTSKVSLWYNGPTLMMLKTNGPKNSETTERSFQLSPDGQTLTVHFSNLANSSDSAVLVFSKTGTLTAASLPGRH
jgi:hypothetical protein